MMNISIKNGLDFPQCKFFWYKWIKCCFKGWLDLHLHQASLWIPGNLSVKRNPPWLSNTQVLVREKELPLSGGNAKLLTHKYKDTTEIKMFFYEHSWLLQAKTPLWCLWQFLKLLQLTAKSGHPQQSTALVLQHKLPHLCVPQVPTGSKASLKQVSSFPVASWLQDVETDPKVLRVL